MDRTTRQVGCHVTIPFLMKRERAPNAVSVMVDGQQHDGHWILDGGLVRVTSAYGVKSTQLGGSPATLIAQRLLRELVQTGLEQTRPGR
jgi:hypothetical protein